MATIFWFLEINSNKFKLTKKIQKKGEKGLELLKVLKKNNKLMMKIRNLIQTVFKLNLNREFSYKYNLTIKKKLKFNNNYRNQIKTKFCFNKN